MKKIILSTACFLLIAASSFAALPNEKVLKSFHSTFNSATEVKWFDHADYYEVSFVQSDIRTMVKYDKEGNFISSNRYYKEQQLPTYIFFQLKKRYPGKAIFGVTELTNSDEINYYVKLEDQKNWITVKVSANGQMEVVEKYRKA
jgi:hypothetical protein